MADSGEAAAAQQGTLGDGQVSCAAGSECVKEVEESSISAAEVKTGNQKDATESMTTCVKKEQDFGQESSKETEGRSTNSAFDVPGPSDRPSCNTDLIIGVSGGPAALIHEKDPKGSGTNPSSDSVVSQGSDNFSTGSKVIEKSSIIDAISDVTEESSNNGVCTRISQSSSNNEAVAEVSQRPSDSDVSNPVSQVPASSESGSQAEEPKTETTDDGELSGTADHEEKADPKAEDIQEDARSEKQVAMEGDEEKQQDAEGSDQQLNAVTCGQTSLLPLDDGPGKAEVNPSLAESNNVADGATKPTESLCLMESFETAPRTEEQPTGPEPALLTDVCVSNTIDFQRDNVKGDDHNKSRDEDKVNNNTHKLQSFCEDASHSYPSISNVASASSLTEAPEMTGQGDGDDEERSAAKPESRENTLKKPDQSVLMQYLGLQPVKEVEKLSGRQTCENKLTSSVRTKFGLSFFDPFSTMPSPDLMDPYEKIYSSPYTLPFEVCSEGSRSPELPMLAETPVVGSSPPRHDYDAMEAKMINMTPRGISPTDKADHLATVPSFDQSYKNTNIAFTIGRPNNDDHLEKQDKKMKFITKSLLDRSEGVQMAAIFPPDIPCPRCNRTFKSRSQLRGHLRWHINDPINLLSGRWQAEKGSVDDRKPSDKDMTSIPLPQKIDHRSNLQTSSTYGKAQNQGKVPRKSLKEDAFCCSFCPKKFQTSLKLRGHMIVHKRKHTKTGSLLRRKASITRSTQSSFRCEVCSKVFDARLKLRGHMISHSKEFHPRSKGVKRFRTNKDETKGISSVPSEGKQKFVSGAKKSFRCEICFKTFSTQRARNGHQGIHSMKWQQANDLHHLGRPSKKGKNIESKVLTSALCQAEDLQYASEAKAEASDDTRPTKSIKQNRVFKCSKCSLVFATKHRVRKHLFKVHSDFNPSTASFSEEHVDGCRFCEVFKKRKRGRPKRGENTLMTCVHGKSVIGYNLPLSGTKSMRKNKMIRMKKDASHQLKKPKELDEITTENTTQPNLSENLDVSCPEQNLDVNSVRGGRSIHESSCSGNAVQVVKRRGRPPKKHSNSIVRLKAKRNALYHSKSVKSRLGRDGTNGTSVSSFRNHGHSKRLTFLGRHMKSGWDPKKQRFIGRPYKCHLCKMSYRSERQLCSHMRTHGIHVFDLSQLPVDQQGDGLRLNECDGTRSEDVGELQLQATSQHTVNETTPASATSDACSTRKSSESGVGGTCSVCTKEFDSDNMFHQHLLGRFNKKCRQEWMKHTFGFGMRSKVTVSPRHEMVAEDASHQSPEDKSGDDAPKDAPDKNSGNLCVIDKIGIGSLPGTGVFTTLQQKNNSTVTGEHGETSHQNSSLSSTASGKTDVQQLFKLGNCAPHVDAVAPSLPSPRKGAVLDAVINRLTQSTKTTDSSSVDQVVTVSATDSSTLPACDHPASSKLLFKCDHCAKTFDRKQKLCVHSRIHKPKIVTVMDHIEHATQQNIPVTSSSSSSRNVEEDEEKDQTLSNGVAVMDNHHNSKMTDILPVPELQLTYPCTECPKQFASNLKLANHLKMHMKSTKAKTSHSISVSAGKSGSLRVNVPEPNVKHIKERGNPSHIAHEDETSAENGADSSASHVIKEEQMTGNDVIISADQEKNTVSGSSPCTEDGNKEPGKEETSITDSTGSNSGQQGNPARPRLLLKINPATLQRLYSCEDCSKSFKSRRQLAHHRRLHEVEKLYPEQQSEKDQTLPQKDHESSPKDTLVVTKVTEHVDTHNASSDLPLGQSVQVENDQPLSQRYKDEVPSLDETAKCKICDGIMQKCQLDDHMTSHTKGLLARSFTNPDENDKGQQHNGGLARDEESTMEVSSLLAISQTELGKLSGIQDSQRSCDLTIKGRDTLDVDSDQTSRNGTEIRNHIPTTGLPTARMKQFTCDVCNLAFENVRQLFEHKRSHPVSSVNVPEPYPSLTDTAPTPEEVMKNQYAFGEKTNAYVKPKNYPCELCGYSFSSFHQFRCHISQTHGGKYQYRLMLQQKEAVQTGAFEPEADTVSKTHPHKCDLCGRRFKRLALLMFHLNKLHKGWKQRLCMFDARSKSRVPQMAAQNSSGGGSHVPVAGTAPGDLPFTCELCGKSFRMKVQLCGHMKTHGRVGHSPIKISPMKLKGKYTLRKRGKPDFRLSDDWILDMDDERMASDKSVMQQMALRTDIPKSVNMNRPVDAEYYAPVYPNQVRDPRQNAEPIARKTHPRPHYETTVPVQKSPLGSPGLVMQKSPLVSAGVPMQKSPIGLSAVDLKVPKAPPPPDPSKFITIQLEPVSQQMLHRCLLCHSYFSSQENAVFHCKEVHFKKKQPKYPVASDTSQGTSHPLGCGLLPINGPVSNVRSPSHLQTAMKSPLSPRASRLLPNSQNDMLSSYGRVTSPPLPGVKSPNLAGIQSPPLGRVTNQPLAGIKSPPLGRVPSQPLRGVTSPPLHSRYQASNHQSSQLQPVGTLPKPPSVSTGKMISQTPFNEMLYRVEMSEGQTRYVCNTCKSTFLHYNFLMSHLAEHNHLAYTCLQCGYATYSEKDYQLHCQLHDGQISKKVRRMRPKDQDNESKQASKTSGPFPRAVATCHICQRSFVNLKGLQAHMVLHSANFSSISERRNESKRVQRKNGPIIRAVPDITNGSEESSQHPENASEQTEALDLSCKQVSVEVNSAMDEVLDLSMGSRSFTQESTDPPQEVPKPVTKPLDTPTASLPDVCQVLEKADQPSLSPVEKPVPTARKAKNSIRLVGAIDVDVASLENKYSVVTDLMDVDSDISPDLPPSSHETTSGEGDGETDHSKSPKRLRPYKCSMCQYATDFKDSMDRHEQKHRKFRTLACHQCSYRTPEKRLMLRHVLTIHEKQKPYQCKLCTYSSAYKHHLKRHHTKRHQRPLLTCTHCEFTTEDVTTLEEHCATHQEPQSPQPPPSSQSPQPKVYSCKHCSMVFDSGKLLKKHKHIVHKKKKKSKKSVIDENNSPSSIEGGSESAEGKEKDAPSPELEEPTNLNHQCKLCVYQTSDQNELTKHLMKNHFGNQAKEGLGDVCTTAQCPQCGYLTGKDQMKAHMQIHDSGEFFDCEQCTFKTGSQEELDSHVKQKHKVKPAAKLMCKMCGMHFWDADDMKLHTEVHLRDSSISVKNPFICSLCPLKLMNRRDALRHIQLHTDRYPFKCRHCVFSCFTKASIQRHLTIHKHSAKSKPVAVSRKNSRKSLSGVSSGCGSEDGLPVEDPHKTWRKSQSTTC